MKKKTMNTMKRKVLSTCLALGVVASTILTPATAFAGNAETQLDGKLDTFHQGDADDCGAVSGIDALNHSGYGQELLGKLITDNYNGTYTLNFGAGKQTVTQADVYNAHITGDLDARVIEAGLQKAMNVYNGCFACDVFAEMTGFKKVTYTGSSAKTKIMNLMQTDCDNSYGITAACDFTIADDSKGIIGDGGHSYSVGWVWDDTVVVINPWDTSKPIYLSRSQFENSIRYMTYVDWTNKKVMVFWT